MKKLILYRDSCGDEFDIYGMNIVTEKFWNWYTEVAKKIFKTKGHFTKNFGTNEFIEYNSLEDFLSCFSVSLIPEEHAEIITKYFGKNWGEGIPELYFEEDN